MDAQTRPAAERCELPASLACSPGFLLSKLGLYAKLQPKIVKGSSIAQAYQFTTTGAAELGFVALSQVINEQGGSRWVVPTNLHAPIDQQAILLFNGEKKPAAKSSGTSKPASSPKKPAAKQS